MLVLTRKQQEKIRIGDDIVVTVLRMKGKSVRLGIEAPGDIAVLRGELVFDITDDDDKAADEPSTGSRPNAQTSVRAPSATWPADTHPRSAVDGDDNRAEVDVGVYRVPREHRAEILPQLVHNSGPLRAMLDRRAIVR
jgi:carbon storage regulator